MSTPFPRLTADVTARPDLFVWYGPCEPSRLTAWLREQPLDWPEDLRSLWLRFGGGELFENEDIAVPFGGPEYALSVQALDEQHRPAGLPSDIVLFHSGLCLSGVRRGDGAYVTLQEAPYMVRAEYSSLDDWYRSAIRTEYARRYGLRLE